MSFEAMTWAIKQELDGPTPKLLLVMVANYADQRGQCFPGQKTLAKDCGVTDRTVREWLDVFEERGLLRRERRNRANGSRTSDLITLNLPEEFSVRLGVLPEDNAEPTGSSFRPRTLKGNIKKGKSDFVPTGPLVRVEKIRDYDYWDRVVKLYGKQPPAEVWWFPPDIAERAASNLPQQSDLTIITGG